MPKLTLSVNEGVVRRAKRYADKHDTSVSRLVERFLDLLSKPPRDKSIPPILSRLRGSLRGADSADYRRYLSQKYR